MKKLKQVTDNWIRKDVSANIHILLNDLISNQNEIIGILQPRTYRDWEQQGKNDKAEFWVKPAKDESELTECIEIPNDIIKKIINRESLTNHKI